MIALGREKNLRLEFQTAESLAVDNPVTVPLKIRSQVTGRLGSFAPGTFRGTGGIRRQQKVFLLLQTLLENRNIVMDREKLISRVCGYDYVGETNIIDVYVRYLRSKIDDKWNISLIQTVRGIGYVIRDGG